MLVDRRRERNRFEQIDAGAGEQGEPVHRRFESLDVVLNLLSVLLEAVALGRARPVRPDPIGQFLAEKRLESILAALVRLQVEVQADDGEGTRFDRGETV